MILFRINTDTSGQYDEWIQGKSQGRPIVTWRTHPLTTRLQMNSCWKLEPLGPWTESINQGILRESGQNVLPVTQARKRGWHISRHHVKWQIWRNVVVRHRDVFFVAMDAFVEKIFVEDLIAKRNVTARSYPCVVDLNCRDSIKPRPDRSRVSGLKSAEFGDLILFDHGESTHIGDQTVGFLLVLDGATTNFTAYPCKSTSPSEVISKLHEWMNTVQMNPKAICADMAFHHARDMRAFYRMHNVKRFPTGSHTVDVKFSVCVTRSWRGNDETHSQEPTQKMFHSFMPGWILTAIVSMMSGYKDSPKLVRSSLGTMLLQMKLKAIRPWASWALSKMNYSIRPRPDKGSQESGQKCLTCHTSREKG